MDKSQLKICVYAICKNEEKFIPRWIESLKEADYITVLDTGSTDNSVSVLEGYSPLVTVQQKIYDDFRFDVARNDAMKMIPEDTDICVVSDCDQVFRPGWADVLKDAFINGADEVYGPIIDYDINNNEEKTFLSKNVHPNKKEWYWERPIHEGVDYHGEFPDKVKKVVRDDFVIEHHPDRTKDRSFYLELLRKEYSDNHTDPMCMNYFALELAFHGQIENSFAVFMNGIKECDLSGDRMLESQIYVNISVTARELGKNYLSLYYAKKAYDTGIKTRRIYMTLARALKACGKLELARLVILDGFKNVHINLGDWTEDENLFKTTMYDELAEITLEEGNYGEAINLLSIAMDKSDGALPYIEKIKGIIPKFLEKEGL